MAMVLGFSHDQQMAMPGIVWRRHFELLPRREAERNLAAAQIAFLPNLTESDARRVMSTWQDIASQPLRALGKVIGDSWDSIREWWAENLGAANRQ